VKEVTFPKEILTFSVVSPYLKFFSTSLESNSKISFTTLAFGNMKHLKQLSFKECSFTLQAITV
jgi:hypothetical protein